MEREKELLKIKEDSIKKPINNKKRNKNWYLKYINIFYIYINVLNLIYNNERFKQDIFNNNRTYN